MCNRMLYEMCHFCGHHSVLQFLARSGGSSLQWSQYVVIMISLLVTFFCYLDFYLTEGKS